MKSTYKRLGDFIHKIDVRNNNSQNTKLLGLSMAKEFRPHASNIIGTDLSRYKVVDHWQFACDFMSTIRVRKLPVVLQENDEQIIISPAYTTFEVIDPNELHSEYLMMWFRREEFDRYAYFCCDSAVRGGFNWDELCDVKLPVPSIEKQREIVKEYNTIVNRLKLNEELRQKLEEMSQALYKHWFVDFEFPNEAGKPYKSNGGNMVWKDELEKEIPEGWTIDTLGNITTTIDNRGKTPPHFKTKTNFPLIEIGSLKGNGRNIDLTKCVKYLDEATYNNAFRSGHPRKKDILFSTVGSLADLKIINNEKCSIAQNIVGFRCKENIGYYLYQTLTNSLNEILQYDIGAVQGSIKVSQIVDLQLLVPNDHITELFEQKIQIVADYISNKTNINIASNKMKDILLSKMTEF
jgi:type I restriction enzyme, S subunit